MSAWGQISIRHGRSANWRCDPLSCEFDSRMDRVVDDINRFVDRFP